MSTRPLLVLFAPVLLLSGAVFAESPKGAADKSVPAASQSADGNYGTTIFGDKESPLGLYITPWKQAEAERGLDRPARLFDETIEPIDRGTFSRQLAYWKALTDYRKGTGADSSPTSP